MCKNSRKYAQIMQSGDMGYKLLKYWDLAIQKMPLSSTRRHFPINDLKHLEWISDQNDI